MSGGDVSLLYPLAACGFLVAAALIGGAIVVVLDLVSRRLRTASNLPRATARPHPKGLS